MHTQTPDSHVPDTVIHHNLTLISTQGSVHSLLPSRLLNQPSPIPALSESPPLPSPLKEDSTEPGANLLLASSKAAPAKADIVWLMVVFRKSVTPGSLVPSPFPLLLLLPLLTPLSLERMVYSLGVNHSAYPYPPSEEEKSTKHRPLQWQEEAKRMRSRKEQ